MGAVISTESIAELAESNDLLKHLVGSEPMNSNDPQWNKLFSFNFNLDQNDRKVQLQFLEHINPLLEQLMHNTRDTHNFAMLVRVFNRRSAELKASAKCENKIFIWQACNALLIIRYISIFLAQRLSPSEFARIFGRYTSDYLIRKVEFNTSTLDGRSCETDKDKTAQETTTVLPKETINEMADSETENGESYKSAAEQFMTNLLNILIDVPVSSMTLQLHAETVRVLLALLSTQLYEKNVNERSEFLRLLMLNFRSQSGELVRVLMENFLQHHSEQLDYDASADQNKTDGLVVFLWTTLQKTLAFGYSIEEYDESQRFPQQSLAVLSLLLLLCIVYYPGFSGQQNPYKQMLSIFQNAQEVSSLANLEASFKLDFSQLYNRLCQTIYKERPPLLLLYLLIHNNIGFRNFILSRINLEQLVLPVTRVLYDGMCSNSGLFPSSSTNRQNSLTSPNSSRRNSLSNTAIHTHQIYLALIVLLMLSEDDFFKKVIHEMTLKNIEWYQSDRAPLSEITLGGLIVLVFSKTIQINTVRVRDRYFHMNSLATLANLSSCFKQLSPLVCQKLIGLLETMTKRHAKLIRMLRENAERESINLTKTNAEKEDDLQEFNDDLHKDITALEEGIRTVLEIINACLCNNLRNNPDLIYTILYKRELFEQYHQHPMFQDLVWNIYAVINHFTARVGALISASSGSPINTSCSNAAAGSANGIASNASVAEILDAIKKIAIEWPTDRLKKFPDLRFRYIEDENTVDFFIPYIWRLVHQGAGLMFDPMAIQLFKATD